MRLNIFLYDHLIGRAGFAIVGADIAHDFAVQIFDPSKDAACDEIALNFREPDFDLIEPRRICRRVMNAHLGMTSQIIRPPWSYARSSYRR